MSDRHSSPTPSSPFARASGRPTRRSFCAAVGAGAFAGCLQLEEADGDGQSAAPSDDAATTDAFEDEPEGTPVDDPENLELVARWERDLRDAVVLDGAFVGAARSRTDDVDAPRLERYAADGEVRWASDEIDSDYRFEFHRSGDVVAAGDTLIAVARDDHDGVVYAFDTDSGERRWSDAVRLDRTVGGWVLSLADGLAAVAAVVDESADETAVRGYDASDGTRDWETTVDLGYLTGAERLGDRLLLFGWRQGGGEILRVDVDAGSGAVLEETLLDVSSPQYVPSGDGDRLYFHGGEIHAYDPASDAFEWAIEVDRRIGPGVDLEGDVLVGGNQSGWVIARDTADGSVIWETRIDGSVTDSLTAAGGIVWAGDHDELVAIDASTGEVVYTYEDAHSVAAMEAQVFVGDTAYDLESDST